MNQCQRVIFVSGDFQFSVLFLYIAVRNGKVKREDYYAKSVRVCQCIFQGVRKGGGGFPACIGVVSTHSQNETGHLNWL